MIVINGRFLTQDLTGVQRFALEISSKLFELNKNAKIVCVTPNNIKSKYNDYIKNWEIIKFGNKTGHLWEQTDLIKFLKLKNNPLILNFTNTGPIFYKNKIVTLHDVSFIRCPNAFSFKFKLVYKLLIPLLLKNSKKIFTVSNFSKNEILDVYKFVNPSDIEVIYNAVDKKFRQIKTKSKNKYILGLSSLNPRKNFVRLIKSFVELKKEINDKNLKLYLIGNISGNFKNNEILNLINNNKTDIKIFSLLDDEQIIELYSGAELFIYPSLYEGFGIPPLEAQACEIPVISSNVSSLPEVLSDSVLYCNPLSIKDIKDKMKQLLEDTNLRKELIEKGKENIKQFDWTKSAQKVVDVINNIKE